MGKRANQQPALYEMMRSRAAAAPANAQEAAPEPPPPKIVRHEPVEDPRDLEPGAPPAVLEMLRPGRTIRLPVGYIFLGIAALITLVAVAYVIGNMQGDKAANKRLAENFQSPSVTPGVNDPLTLDADRSPQGNAAPAATNGGKPATSGGTPRGSATWGPIEPKTDPRQKGLNYFILAETTPQGAVKLAEFCRNSGLETYVVAGKNGRRRVIAFPGYQGSRLAPEVKSLEDRIHAIGDKYKSESKGETNMRDAYPSRFEG